MLACLISGCATTPPLALATLDVPPGAIVERVKCELADAFDRQTDDQRYKWLADWTVKTDLTLIANENAGVTPGGSLIEPLRNAYPNVVGPLTMPPGNTLGPVKQQFSLGVGANLGGQGVRTEYETFSLSLKELKAWRNSSDGVQACTSPDGYLLSGNLDLKGWVDPVLAQVGRELWAGDHPTQTIQKAAAAPAAPPPGAAPHYFLVFPKERAARAADAADKAAKRADGFAQQADDTIQEALRSLKALKTSPYYNILDENFEHVSRDIVTIAVSQANKAKIFANKADAAANEAQALASSIQSDTSEGAEATAKRVDQLAKDAADAATHAKAEADAATANAKAEINRKPNPPIDALTHSVQFIITYGASITPTWTLVRWQGPTGPLAFATGVTTHTLNIAIAPRPESAPPINPEVARALDNLNFQQAIQPLIH